MSFPTEIRSGWPVSGPFVHHEAEGHLQVKDGRPRRFSDSALISKQNQERIDALLLDANNVASPSDLASADIRSPMAEFRQWPIEDRIGLLIEDHHGWRLEEHAERPTTSLGYPVLRPEGPARNGGRDAASVNVMDTSAPAGDDEVTTNRKRPWMPLRRSAGSTNGLRTRKISITELIAGLRNKGNDPAAAGSGSSPPPKTSSGLKNILAISGSKSKANSEQRLLDAHSRSSLTNLRMSVAEDRSPRMIPLPELGQDENPPPTPPKDGPLLQHLQSALPDDTLASVQAAAAKRFERIQTVGTIISGLTTVAGLAESIVPGLGTALGLVQSMWDSVQQVQMSKLGAWRMVSTRIGVIWGTLTKSLQIERCIRVVEGVQQAVIASNGRPVPDGMAANIESLVE